MGIMRSTVNHEGKTEDDKLPVVFGSETLNLTYSKAEYTPEAEERINELVGTGKGSRMLSMMLLTVLTGWDMEDWHPDDMDKPEDQRRKVPVPLTAETLHSLIAIEAQGKIVQALTDAQRPNEETLPATNDSF